MVVVVRDLRMNRTSFRKGWLYNERLERFCTGVLVLGEEEEEEDNVLMFETIYMKFDGGFLNYVRLGE